MSAEPRFAVQDVFGEFAQRRLAVIRLEGGDKAAVLVESPLPGVVMAIDPSLQHEALEDACEHAVQILVARWNAGESEVEVPIDHRPLPRVLEADRALIQRVQPVEDNEIRRIQVLLQKMPQRVNFQGEPSVS